MKRSKYLKALEQLIGRVFIMRVSASTAARTSRHDTSLDDHQADDALSVGSADSNHLGGLPGLQATFGVGALIATTCFASFMTLGLELPAAMVSWGQFRH
ncbi:MAG TPA: hypothetical protein VMV19_16730 [Xanthobacteraceae bacterium]|nr:hypothetical protein [Xanthobacteraceae bacterium]